MTHIAADYSNLQSSLRWLVDHADAHAAQRLAGSLTFFWTLRGRIEEGRNWLTTVLALSGSSTPLDPPRAAAIVGLMQLEIEGGNRAAALTLVESNLSAITESADGPLVAQALIGFGWLQWVTQHDAVSARAHIEDGLALARAHKLGPLEALGRTRLSAIAYAVGDYAESNRLLAENAAYKLGGGESLLGHMDEILHARTLLELGDYDAVESLLADVAHQDHADRHPVAFLGRLMMTCLIRLHRADVDGAAVAALESLQTIHSNLGRYFTPGHLASPLEALAMIASAAGDHVQAIRLAAAAANFRAQYAILLFPHEQSRLEASLASSRAVLGPLTSDAASAAGRMLSLEAVIAEATSAFAGAYTGAYNAHRKS